MTGARPHHEVRTRVTFFLPVNNEIEELAAHSITRYLKTQRTRRVNVTGFTHSQLPDTVFSGYWWSEEKWYNRERIVLFVIDYDISLDDPQLSQTLRRLRNVIKQLYSKYGSEQEEVWIIAQRSIRFI